MADNTRKLTELRRLDSADKTRRVLAALEATISAGQSLTIAALARHARVSRRFIYDHPELRAEANGAPPKPPTAPPARSPPRPGEPKAFSTAAPSSPTVITGATPLHQDGPSVSAKTCGRAVALPQDVLTLASHTTDRNTRPQRPQDPPAASAPR